MQPGFKPTLHVSQSDVGPSCIRQRLSERALPPVDEPPRRVQLRLAPGFAVPFLERQRQDAARAGRPVARPQSLSQVLSVEVEKDGVGQDGIEGAAEISMSYVQDSSLVTGLSKTIDERRRRVRALDA